MLKYLSYAQKWNIGFTDDTPESLILNRRLGPVHWLKHPFKDRWFADPFILYADEERIVVFVEEFIIDKGKGTLAELVVDRRRWTLVEHYELLELDTHLSYPFILRNGDDIYVCPENYQSGKFAKYKYDPARHILEYVEVIVDLPLVDSTFVPDGKSSIAATYNKSSLFDILVWDQNSKTYVLSKRTNSVKSRPARNYFSACGNTYRPSQNCSKRYGGSLLINQVLANGADYSEVPCFELFPNSFSYCLGLHTLNMGDGVCVIDGKGYYYPILGRLFLFIKERVLTKLKALHLR